MSVVRATFFAVLGIFVAGAGTAKSPTRPLKSSVTLNQGEVARWPGVAAKTCVLAGKKYPPVDSVCYYPFDVEARPGRYAIALVDQNGRRHNALANVEQFERPQVNLTLPDDTYIHVAPENQQRARRERERVLKLYSGPAGAPLFSLPLGAPASPLPKEENNFGSLRIFNGAIESRHSGRDYAVNEGTPVKAIADGTVMIADEHFLTGNSVYIDHGDGLISASFHMSAITVQPGDEVHRGGVIGKVGATGRATGAHLHLGLRWLGARIDPQPLLSSPTKLHDVGEAPASAERKAQKARAEPIESQQTRTQVDEG